LFVKNDNFSIEYTVRDDFSFTWTSRFGCST